MNQRLCVGSIVWLLACGMEGDQSAGQTSEHATSADDGSTSSGELDASSGPAAASTGSTSGDASTGDASTGDPSELSTSTDPFPASSASVAETTGAGEDSLCGDGVVQDGEECDDPGDLHCHNCWRDRLVFVTSQGFHGDWAKSGLDAWCNYLALEAGLLTDYQPRFKTWASTSLSSAADRMVHSPGRYVMVNDLVFAESWDDLVAGNLLNTLNVDENSQTRDYPVWTGTAPDGSAIADASHCHDWTDESLEDFGHYGLSFEIDGQWTLLDSSANPTLCGATAALYCFESP